jgi:hypothetical protein
MGISAKGSRRIVVDGRRYIWRNYGNKSNYIGSCTGVICIIAQEETRAPGRPMRAWLRCKELDTHPEYVDDPENMCSLRKFAFKPSDVVTVIRAALAAGWDPQSKGAAFDVITPIDLPLWYIIQDDKNASV